MTTFVDRHRSDFDYNNSGLTGSFADILWRDDAGNNVLWLMSISSPTTTALLPTVPPDWHFKAAADFDGASLDPTRNADILWQNDNGALALWKMNGATVSAISSLPNPGPTWHVVGDNDFDGDASGGDDILFRNDNGAVAMWTGINPATGAVSNLLASTLNPGPTWHVVATGDTTGDGQAGILWQNDDGAIILWENPSFAAGTFTYNVRAIEPTVGPTWHAKGMADLNGDNRSDVVFQHDSGAVVVWEMGGASGVFPGTRLVNINPGPAWHIVGLRDMDHDGKADIVFQDDNGAPAFWGAYTTLGLGTGSASFTEVFSITNPNPNGHVWDLL